ncbi:Uncharacterized membrane protein YczE [Brevibacterium siliguriense]|uniref:Uncharacterized membrane protein YczE n=1 Tax=Brevibacterium siliguriense TaxID=1136497 RepID=A0A1H1XLB0_9MICO|nr:hypothetical protein [Brevibacterium siliguriense]SDT10010.1 Uncharacterized membrane protein YczE [Brevibacterium siliguriense]
MAKHHSPAKLLNLNAIDQLRSGRLSRRVPQLLLGLIGYGAAVMALVQSGLGAASWNVLTEGIAHQTGLSFGWTTNLIAVVVLIAWIPLKEMPGLGTILNVCLVGLAADWTALFLPPAEGWIEKVVYFAVGMVMFAFFDALYLGAQLGAGPRDGIMTGLTRVTRQPVQRVRTCIEIIVAITGWLLGGTLGIGTVLIALCMGPLLSLFLPRTIVAINWSAKAAPRTKESE